MVNNRYYDAMNQRVNPVYKKTDILLG
uniref:Uncharacterized protein n=1 Tax=Ciona intestinalis TaxID=7719 RepID=H2XSC0_CIOIN